MPNPQDGPVDRVCIIGMDVYEIVIVHQIVVKKTLQQS